MKNLSLIQRLWLLLVLLVLLSLTGALLANLYNARSYLEQQLTGQNANAANSLALMITQHRADRGRGDDHDRVVVGQFVDQFLDFGGGDRIERRAGLVEQDDFGPHRDGARNAKPLLLTAGKALAIGVELVLNLLPQRGTP